MNLHANTKELLKNAQKEIAALKQQLHNMEAQIASQSLQRTPGQGKGEKGVLPVRTYTQYDNQGRGTSAQ